MNRIGLPQNCSIDINPSNNSIAIDMDEIVDDVPQQSMNGRQIYQFGRELFLFIAIAIFTAVIEKWPGADKVQAILKTIKDILDIMNGLKDLNRSGWNSSDKSPSSSA